MDRGNAESHACGVFVRKIDQALSQVRFIQVGRRIRSGGGLDANASRVAEGIEIGQAVFRQQLKNREAAVTTKRLFVTTVRRPVASCSAMETGFFLLCIGP